MPFDLVLLDVMMPGISGLEVLTQIRRTFTSQQLPIIMVTANSMSNDVVEALKLGISEADFDAIVRPEKMIGPDPA